MRPRRRFSTSVCCVSARPSSHGVPACLIEVSGEAPVPPSWPAIVTWSAFALATPAATVPTPTSDTSLTETRACRVGVLQVVDQLRQVLDRIDVVVRRRRDQADAGRRVAQLGDVLVDLVAGQLAAFAGLGALRHLDLQSVGVDEVLAVTPKRPDATCLIVERSESPLAQRLEAVGVFAAFAGVRLAADAVHRDRERRVRLGRDRAEAHRAGGEALDDLRRRLDLLDRHRRCAGSTLNSNRPRNVIAARSGR